MKWNLIGGLNEKINFHSKSSSLNEIRVYWKQMQRSLKEKLNIFDMFSLYCVMALHLDIAKSLICMTYSF